MEGEVDIQERSRHTLSPNFPCDALLQQDIIHAMIYLIGIGHPLQWDRNVQGLSTFIADFEKKARELEITFIGEEWSEEATRYNHNQSSFKEAADRLGIAYRACDAIMAERVAMGERPKEVIRQQLRLDRPKSVQEIGEQQFLIKREEIKDYRYRENYWMNKILDKVNENIFFILGLEHISGANKLMWEALWKTNNADMTTLPKPQGFDLLLQQHGYQTTYLNNIFSGYKAHL